MASPTCKSHTKSGQQCSYNATYEYKGQIYCGIHIEQMGVKSEATLIGAKPARIVNPNVYFTCKTGGSLTSSAAGCFVFHGIKFTSVRQAYEMMKFYYPHRDHEINEALYKHASKFPEASSIDKVCLLGQSTEVPIREDWSSPKETRGTQEGFSVRDCYMFEILLEKFRQNPTAKAELIASGGSQFVDEGFGGNYWSVGPNSTGKNRYGEILMAVRTQISRE